MIENKYLIQFSFETLVNVLEISKNDSYFDDIKQDIRKIDNAIISKDKNMMIILNKYILEKYLLGSSLTNAGLERVPDNILLNMSLEKHIGVLDRMKRTIIETGSKSLVQKLLEATAKAGIETAGDYVEDKLVEGIMGEDATTINYLKEVDGLISKAQKIK